MAEVQVMCVSYDRDMGYAPNVSQGESEFETFPRDQTLGVSELSLIYVHLDLIDPFTYSIFLCMSESTVYPTSV